jgi:hypothetical protein
VNIGRCWEVTSLVHNRKLESRFKSCFFNFLLLQSGARCLAFWVACTGHMAMNKWRGWGLRVLSSFQLATVCWMLGLMYCVWEYAWPACLSLCLSYYSRFGVRKAKQPQCIAVDVRIELFSPGVGIHVFSHLVWEPSHMVWEAIFFFLIRCGWHGITYGTDVFISSSSNMHIIIWWLCAWLRLMALMFS